MFGLAQLDRAQAEQKFTFFGEQTLDLSQKKLELFLFKLSLKFRLAADSVRLVIHPKMLAKKAMEIDYVLEQSILYLCCPFHNQS